MPQAQQLFKEFNKKYKAELFSVGTVIHNSARIPFSSPGANRPLYGGIPRGRVIEFSGEEGSGKTTTALDIVANAQKLFQQEWEDKIKRYEESDKLTKEQKTELLELRENGPLRVLWIDCENTFDDEWSTKLGVDVEKLYYMSPESQSAEEIFEMTNQVINTGEIGLCVIDSLGMMVSQQEMDKDIEDATYGGISRALTKFSKKVELTCAKTNCALIGINQVRDNLNAGYGGPTTVTPGGKCWKHVCSVRLEFRAGTPFDEKFEDVKKSFENPYGHRVMISVKKTKICKPDRKLGSYTLVYETGINALQDIVDIAINKYDIIHKAGAWFTFVNPQTGELIQGTDENGENFDLKVQGQKNVVPFLKQPENEELLNMIVDFVNSKIYS